MICASFRHLPCGKPGIGWTSCRPASPSDWKIGEGVKEIRLRDEAGTFRVTCLAKLATVVYVLYRFRKKAQETSEKDIKLARKRFKNLMKERP